MKKVKILVVVWICCLSFYSTVYAQSNSGRMAGQGAGDGALIGALAGAIFGDGDFVGNAFDGALVGAGVGALAGALEGGRLDRQQKEEFEALVKAFGEENLKGYIALGQCEYDKAIALFNVSQVSGNGDHKLAGLWLEAVAEKDRKNNEQASALLDELVKADPDIDDQEMAKTALNQYVLDLRADRRSFGLPSCSY